MPDAKSYPYATRLNVLYPPLEVVDVPALIAACADRWYNQTLCRGIRYRSVPAVSYRRSRWEREKWNVFTFHAHRRCRSWRDYSTQLQTLFRSRAGG